MVKYSIKQLKELVNAEIAVDLTNKDLSNWNHFYSKVGYSKGVYGVNGLLIYDREDGCLCVVYGRCTNLFVLL